MSLSNYILNIPTKIDSKLMKDQKFTEEVSRVINILGNGKIIILDSSNIDEDYAIIPFFTTVMIPSDWLTKLSGYDGITAALNESTQTNKPQPLGAPPLNT